MLIGNRKMFAFEVLPVAPSWERRYQPEAAAWAALSIWARGSNLCRHTVEGSNEVRDSLFVPLVPIAEWLRRSFLALKFEERAPEFATTRDLHDSLHRWGTMRSPSGMDSDAWLDARERWWSHHFLTAGADGATLPNLAFVRDDEELVVAWARPRFAGIAPPQMLEPSGACSVPWTEGQATLSGLINLVAESLRGAGLHGVFPWAAAPTFVPEQGTLESALELFTGRSLAALREALSPTGNVLDALGLAPEATDPAASPISQALRDLPPRLSPSVGSALASLDASTKTGPTGPTPGWKTARALAADARRAATTPEEAGQLVASALREDLALNAQPIDELGAFLKRLDVKLIDDEVRGQTERMVAGAREDGAAAALVLRGPRTKTPWGRRFEEARALGHILLDPLRGGALGAASSPFAQETRRRRSGAFAAELLVPEAALAEASDGQLDGATKPTAFEKLMKKYGVGARTAAQQLFNRGWLSSSGVRDELIELRAHAG